MNIQGLHYLNPSIWTGLVKPLRLACAQALQVVAGDCLTRCHAQALETNARRPLLVEALLGNQGGIVHQTLAQLAPTARKLGRRPVDSEGTVTAYDLMVDLVIALGRHFEAHAATAGASPKYIGFMAVRLARVNDPQAMAQLSTVAFQVFHDLRYELSLETMRELYGIGESVNWLARKLSLVDTVQNECLRFLDNWSSHPNLAALIVGHDLHMHVQDMGLRRALRVRNVPAPWLMRWDQNYVHITTQIANRSGVPLNAKHLEELKPPLSSQRPDTFICTEETVAKLLDALATLHSLRVVSTAVLGQLEGILRTQVVADDDDVRTLPAPPDSGLWDSIDGGDEESREGDASPTGEDSMGHWEVQTDGQPEDDADLTDEPDKEADGAHGNELGNAADLPTHQQPPPQRRRGLPALPPSAQAVTEQCLAHLPMAVRVGVMVALAKGMTDQSERQQTLDELQAQYIEEGVFETLCALPRISTLTPALLAAHTPNNRAERGVSLLDYTDARERALTELRACARRCLEQMRPQVD